MDISVMVERSSLDDLILSLEGIPGNISSQVDAALVQWGQDTLDYIRNTLLSGQMLHEKTGALKASVMTEPRHLAPLEVELGFDQGEAPHGGIFVQGANHSWIITAINHKVLHFVIGGQDIFVKTVTHPPMYRRDFMAQGMEDKLSDLRTMITEAIAAGIEE